MFSFEVLAGTIRSPVYRYVIGLWAFVFSIIGRNGNRVFSPPVVLTRSPACSFSSWCRPVRMLSLSEIPISSHEKEFRVFASSAVTTDTRSPYISYAQQHQQRCERNLQYCCEGHATSDIFLHSAGKSGLNLRVRGSCIPTTFISQNKTRHFHCLL